MRRITWLDAATAKGRGLATEIFEPAPERAGRGVADLQAAVAALYGSVQPQTNKLENGGTMNELLKKFAKLLGLPEAAIKTDDKGQATPEAVALLEARLEAETARADAAAKAAEQARRQALIDQALADGRLTEAVAKGAVAKLDLGSLEALLSSIPKGAAVPMGQGVSGAAAADGGSLESQQHARICKLFGHDPKNVK
jgi:hypothetical protein